MPIALISDIHGNAEALEAVLAHIRSEHDVEAIVCLGDIIGYGPDPTLCLDLVQEHCEFALMGNHDFAALYEPTGFNTTAEQAAFWTRQQFEDEPDAAERRRRWQYLGSLAIRRQYRDALWVHASPRRPINEYIFPDDPIAAPAKMRQIFERVDARCFCGHTHQPGVFTDEPDFYAPEDLNGKYLFQDGEKCIVNPGSVGQPRDRDPRASYAVLEDHRVTFHRVEYDIGAVIEKVNAVPELNEFLGQRLLDGR